MAKLNSGYVMPDFIYDTPYEKGLSFSETVKKSEKTILVFLRYYGCPICQLDIHQYAEVYKDIKDAGKELYIVLQSDADKLAEKLGSKDALPYSIICDPEMKLYKSFNIEPAKSMAKMVDFKAIGKIIKSTKQGYKHGEYEGNEQQLPAIFIVDKEMKVSYAHYAKSLGDMPAPKDVVKLG